MLYPLCCIFDFYLWFYGLQKRKRLPGRGEKYISLQYNWPSENFLLNCIECTYEYVYCSLATVWRGGGSSVQGWPLSCVLLPSSSSAVSKLLNEIIEKLPEPLRFYRKVDVHHSSDCQLGVVPGIRQGLYSFVYSNILHWHTRHGLTTALYNVT